MKKKIASLLRLVESTCGTLYLQKRGIITGSRCTVYGLPVVNCFRGSRIKFGDDVTLISRSGVSALGVSQPSVLRTLRSDASILIGDDVGMTGVSICAAASIEVGSGVLMGSGVLIADTDFHPVAHSRRRYEPIPDSIFSHRVVVEENVFLGARAIITKGVVVGKNSVVGAGSIVTKDIPPNCVAAGNPARPLRKLWE